MYLRYSTVTKNGKTHTYWRLVRSVRVGSKVRQETVAQLGELDAQGRIAAKYLADAIVGASRNRVSLMSRPQPNRSRSILAGCGWSAAGGSVTSGSAGGSGGRSGSSLAR